MAKYLALMTIVHTSKDSIPPRAVFDPATVGISAADITSLLLQKAVLSAPEDAAITYPIAPVAAPNAPDAPAVPKQTAQAVIAFIQTITDLVELEKLGAGEDRVTVTKAIQLRRSTLELAAAIATVNNAADDTALDQLAEGETRREVIEAIEKRRLELEPNH